MKIMTDRELKLFDNAYKLGFRAGQLNWRQQIIDGHYRIRAEAAGVWIAVKRDNIILEEYAQIQEGEDD